MKILYMGTAAAEGWPALFCSCPVCTHAREQGGKNLRTRTQALLDGELLIDFPPDTYSHALRYGLDLGKIHTLLVTHSHMDHWFPADLVHRHEHFGHGTDGILNIYGNEAVEKAFRDNILIERFKEQPLDDVVHFHTIHAGDHIQTEGWEIIAVPADHDKLEERLIYICKKDGKTLLYGHDTGCDLSWEAWDLLKQERFNLVSLDATLGMRTIGRYHMGLPEVEKILERLTEYGCIDERTVKVINHFGHNGKMTHDQLCAWGHDRGILATYDGLEIEC